MPVDQHRGAMQKLQRLEQKQEKMASAVEKAREEVETARKALSEAGAAQESLTWETEAMRLEVRKLAMVAIEAKGAPPPFPSMLP